MPNRTLLIAGNWKMNNDVAEAAKLADELAQALPEVPAGVEVLVCPPTIDITTVHDRIQAAPIALGAQNVYWEAKGAFTGESSCDMLKSAGCTYCIIGHSERRDYFHETDEDQNKKAKALVAAGLVPVFCCGESLEVREAGTYVEHVVNQVKAGLEGLEITCPKQVVVAYEPIWAIGTGKTATAEDAQEVCGAIRETLKEMFGEELADGIRVLYGGSAKPGNIAELVAKPDVDGASWAALRSRLPTSPLWSSRQASRTYGTASSSCTPDHHGWLRPGSGRWRERRRRCQDALPR